MKTEKREIYVAFDGKPFFDKAECEDWERQREIYRFVGLSYEKMQAVDEGRDDELAAAFERFGTRLARSRRDSGVLRRKSPTAGTQEPAAQEPAMTHETAEPTDIKNGVAADHLKSFVERIERLSDEKQAIADDIKDVYAEAKGAGFETKAIRQIIKIRKQDAAERKEMEAIIDLYEQALGMA